VQFLYLAASKGKNVAKEEKSDLTPLKPSQKKLDITFLSSIGEKISGTVEEVHQRAETNPNLRII